MALDASVGAARDAGIYLERYALNGWTPNTTRRAPGVGPLRGWLFLHRFWGPDPDRGLHNHPSEWAVSIGLAGGYVEARQWEPRVRSSSRGLLDRTWKNAILDREYRAPFVNRIAASTFHRITRLLAPPGETWTLFVMGPKHGGGWGFLLPGLGFVKAKDYPAAVRAAELEEWKGDT